MPNENCKWNKVPIWHASKLPWVPWFVFKKPTVSIQPAWGGLHLTDHFSLMDVASVTMLWACFSNGMSIILPRKVKAPWKTEYKLPERMLENYRLLFLRTLSYHENILDPTWGMLTFLPNFWEKPEQIAGERFLFILLQRQGRGKKSFSILMERKKHIRHKTWQTVRFTL